MNRKKEILQLYNDGLSIAAIAENLDIDTTMVEGAIIREQERLERLHDRQQAEATRVVEVYNKVRSVEAAAELLGCGTKKIYAALQYCNQATPRTAHVQQMEERIVERYVNGNKVQDIAKAYNVSLVTVYQYLRRAGYDVKDSPSLSDNTQSIINDLLTSARERGYISRIAAKHGVSRQLVSAIAHKYLD